MSRSSNIPFFGLSLGYTIFYLSLIVLLPLSILFVNVSSMSIAEILNILSSERVVSAFKLTIVSSFIAAVANTVIGVILAWTLVRYEFPGKKIVDGLVDIPFALPTAIAGVALTVIYSNDGIMGGFLGKLGIEIVYTQAGIVMALIFVGLPFVVRTIEPVLRELDKDVEDAAFCLGASRFQVFCKIIFPTILPSILTGFALALARGLGEYGSVIFIAGNIPKSTETLSLLLYIKLEQYNFDHASLIAAASLIVSFLMIYSVNLLQKWSSKYSYGV